MTRRVLIIGSGFAGLAAARVLTDSEADVTVVDRTNHHLFQPLLYQVATATLAAPDITAPIRWLVRKAPNIEVLMADVTHIDPVQRRATIDDGRQLAYDYLIVAAGARHSYFGHDDWEQFAPGLKSIDDALEIRRRFLLAFEMAERAQDATERAAWLTFVIVGAGPTGVELAGMLPTIAQHALTGEFHHIDPATARVYLVEGGPRVLPTFPADLAAHAEHDLRELGVDVRTGAIVNGVDGRGVTIGREHERITARTVFWAAGNAASPLGAMLGASVDRAGRVHVSADLSVAEHPDIFVTGDLAAMTTDDKPVPGVAPAAMQSGACAARNVLHAIRGQPREDFHYHNKGDLATIGRYRAIAAFGSRHVSGYVAWWLWLFVHIMYLAGFRNRLSVLFEWGWSFFTYQRGARLIERPTGPDVV
jgi:NADH dehydrogenase